MKRKIMYCLMAAAFVTSCGGSSSSNAEGGEQEAFVPKPITWENLMGKWTILDDEFLTQKNLAGKEIEFVQDSIFMYDENGNSIHRYFEINPTYGPRVETTFPPDEFGGVTRTTGVVSMNFHEMEPDKLMYMEEGKTIPMRQVK